MFEKIKMALPKDPYSIEVFEDEIIFTILESGLAVVYSKRNKQLFYSPDYSQKINEAIPFKELEKLRALMVALAFCVDELEKM